jgi:putative oxidoreductase
MTTTTLSTPGRWLAPLHALLARAPDNALLLAARAFPAAIFWQSGQTKVDGFALSENAIFLFQEEYRLPLLPPELAATLAAVAEHVFPVLLVLGLATRLSALALIGMTATIQVFVYPDAWPTHGVWAVALLLVAAKGPGAWSVDRALGIEARLSGRAAAG